MPVIQVLKTGTTSFNKAGYRLKSVRSLSVSQKAADAGAVLVKRAAIEHKNGEEILVERWIGKDGKAIKTIHFSSQNPDERIITDYKWSSPLVYDAQDPFHQYLKQDSPLVFGNYIGEIKRCFMKKLPNSPVFKTQKVAYTNLDINKECKTVTKSVGAVDKELNATSEIYSIQNGKKVRGITLKAQRQENGSYNTVDRNYFGIQKEDAEMILGDDYFYTRFLPPTLFAKCGVGTAAKNQGVSYTPKVVLSEYKDYGYASNDDKEIALFRDMVKDKYKFPVVDALEHESAHLHQREMVEKYIKGELTDESQINQAKIYKENYDNYISPFKDLVKYRSQPVEEEAYNMGFQARHRYYDVTDKIKQIFPYSTNHSAGA